MAAERPVRRAFWGSAATYAVLLVLVVARLPDRTPLHFGADGAADRWGSPLEAFLALGAVGVVMAVVFGGGAVLMRRVSIGLINLPHKEWWSGTPQREALMRSRLVVDMYALGTMTYALLVVSILALATAADGEAHMPWWMFAGLGTYLAAVFGWIAWMVTRRYRPMDGM